MPVYTKKTIVDVEDHFDSDYSPRFQETEAQMASWVAEGKTDGELTREIVTIEYPTRYISRFTRVWLDQTAAEAYEIFAVNAAAQFGNAIDSFQIIDNS